LATDGTGPQKIEHPALLAPVKIKVSNAPGHSKFREREHGNWRWMNA
jgi:hypothetical protein